VYPTRRDFITVEYQRKDRMKQAEKEALIRDAHHSAPDRAPIHQRLLVSFGTWLEQLGCRLKSRYAEAADLEIQSAALS
jgi:hypothetical protein